MKKLLIVLTAFVSVSSYSSCISGVENLKLDAMSDTELSKYTTLIKDVESCSNNVLSQLKDILSIQSSIKTDQLSLQVPTLISYLR